MRQYCNKGRKHLDEFFSGYLSKENIDDLQAKIDLTTDNCAEIPENNPDGNGSCDSICYAEQ